MASVKKTIRVHESLYSGSLARMTALQFLTFSDYVEHLIREDLSNARGGEELSLPLLQPSGSGSPVARHGINSELASSMFYEWKRRTQACPTVVLLISQNGARRWQVWNL